MELYADEGVNIPSPLQYVYGWVPFNSGCDKINPNYPSNGPAFNDLKATPGFETVLPEFKMLQCNYQRVNRPDLAFNPFAELVHSKKYLNANSYAFSIDDDAGNQNNPESGIYIAMGGAERLPNQNPIPRPSPPINFQTTILVHLGPPAPQHRPAWNTYGICKDGVDTAFPGPNATPDPDGGFTINVVTTASTFKLPCRITMTDVAHSYVYHFNIVNPLPWKPYVPPPNRHPDIRCVEAPAPWCIQISETSRPTAPEFALSAPPPDAK